MMSDAQRLALQLYRRFPGSVRVNPIALLEQAGGAELKVAAYKKQASVGVAQRAAAQAFSDANAFLALDVHLASAVEELQSTESSSFLVPIVARSVCIKRVTYFGVGDDAADRDLCPRWEQVLPRMMYQFLGINKRSFLYSTCLEPQMDDSHPCKNRTAVACEESLTSAVG